MVLVGDSEAHAQRQEKLRAQLEEWFQKFDANGDGQFQRDELRQLLIFLYPNNPAPAEETIDLLIERATAIETASLKVRGNKDGAVSRNELLETVLRYRDHIAEQQYLDKFFDEYDTVWPHLPPLCGTQPPCFLPRLTCAFRHVMVRFSG